MLRLNRNILISGQDSNCRGLIINMQNNSEAATQSGTSELDAVLQVVNELARKSASGNYIYRGEPECYDQVSSSLYRDFPVDLPLGFNVDALQEEDLVEARKFTFETDDFAILTELQHYGGKTNLIDFTADYLIALFFACDGKHLKDGRVVLLEREGEMDDHIYGPRNPINRVIAQKSVFVRPPLGYVEPDDIVIIPNSLKRFMLDYLRKSHGISAQTIYNDLLGFARYREIHQDALRHFHTAFTNEMNGDYQSAINSYTKSLDLNPSVFVYNNRGIAYASINDYDSAIGDFNQAIALDPDDAAAYNSRGLAYASIGDYEHAIEDFDQSIALDPDDADSYSNRGLAYLSKGDYNQAITDFSQSITLDPDIANNYVNRGEAWLHLCEWDNAREDLGTADDMGVDIVQSFRNDYENVADFAQRNGITLPADIAEMLDG